ncbi:MAG: TolC family protein [Spirochaetaceae bacterium]|jgi:outer membrane protein TolC|nr:TolC family protein [Spirochaetaceae bacterium]
MKYARFIIVVLLTASSGIKVEEAGALTLVDAVRLAEEWNFDLKKSAVDMNIARAANKNLWAEFFPSISAGAGVRYNTSIISANSAANNNPSVSLNAGLSFQLNAGLPAAVKLIRLAYETSLFDYEQAGRQLELAVTKQFYTIITEQYNLSILKEKQTQAERQLQHDRIRFENGLLNELNYHLSRLSAESAKLEMNRALSDLAEMTGQFQAALGFEPDEQIQYDGELEIERVELDSEYLIDRYLPMRPDIIVARRNLERLRLTETRQTLSSRAPTLSLSTSWGASMDTPFSDSLSASVNLSIPVESWLPGTKDWQSIKSAAAGVEKAEFDLENIQRSAKTSIRALCANINNSWNSIEIARLRVEIAEGAYLMAERGFSQGTVEFLELETARNSLSGTRQQLLREELSYKSMILDLAAALNIAVDKLFSRSDDEKKTEIQSG